MAPIYKPLNQKQGPGQTQNRYGCYSKSFRAQREDERYTIPLTESADESALLRKEERGLQGDQEKLC